MYRTEFLCKGTNKRANKQYHCGVTLLNLTMVLLILSERECLLGHASATPKKSDRHYPRLGMPIRPTQKLN